MGKKFQTEVENFYVSFSDLLSLLLIFFVYLFSMASLDPVKFSATADSLTQEFASKDAPATSGAFGKMEPSDSSNQNPESRTAEEMLVGKLVAHIEKEKVGAQAKVEVDPKAVKVVLSSPVLFGSGDSSLSQDGINLLAKFGPIFKEVANPLVIEGHTDNVPISNTQYESNWELSFQRTLSVMKFFVTKYGFTPDQMSGTGFGEYRPLVPNNSDLNRAKNRRIEISIIRDYDTKAVDISQLDTNKKTTPR